MRCSLVSCALAVSCAFPAAVVAQDAAATPPAAIVYARVETPDAPLRCFPTAHSPVFEEKLAVGDVVVAGAARDGFREVQLPLGVVGYVHQQFASVSDDSTVTSTANKVSFRYRPNSNEAPLQFVDKGTTFHLVTQDGAWFKVRNAAARAWVAEADIVVFEQGAQVDTLVAGWADFEKRQRAALDEQATLRRQAREAAAAAAAREATMRGLWDRFAAEYRKDGPTQAYDGLLSDLATLRGGLAADDPLTADATRLQQQIEVQQRSLAAIALVKETPTPADIELPKTTVRDPLRHFAAVGWLRFDDGLFGSRSFRLEKGGQVQFYVTCSSGRYDLRLYDGMEVGIRGEADRPGFETMRVLDVDRIEVFAKPPVQ